MSDEQEDRHEAATRSSERENGNMALDAAQDEQDTQKDVSFGESSIQMTRSSSESSTSSSLSSDDEKLLNKTVAPKERVSIYVQVFEEMLNTVLEYESDLFNAEELEMLARFKTMSCKYSLSNDSL